MIDEETTNIIRNYRAALLALVELYKFDGEKERLAEELRQREPVLPSFIESQPKKPEPDPEPNIEVEKARRKFQETCECGPYTKEQLIELLDKITSEVDEPIDDFIRYL